MSKSKDKLTRIDPAYDKWLKSLSLKRYLLGKDKKPVSTARITKALLRRQEEIKRAEQEVLNAKFEE
tara:strand:+ start:6697 stop:6897 length:201 start_codon:yes stop_codon:yes gene_type:complete